MRGKVREKKKWHRENKHFYFFVKYKSSRVFNVMCRWQIQNKRRWLFAQCVINTFYFLAQDVADGKDILVQKAIAHCHGRQLSTEAVKCKDVISAQAISEPQIAKG